MKLHTLLILAVFAFIATRLIQSGEKALILIPLTLAAVFLSALLRYGREG